MVLWLKVDNNNVKCAANADGDLKVLRLSKKAGSVLDFQAFEILKFKEAKLQFGEF